MATLVTMECNWGDEFDLKGFTIYKGDGWQKEKRRLEQAVIDEYLKFPQEKYFGTNEFQEIDSLEEYFEWFREKEITEQQAEDIINAFARYDYEKKWNTYSFGDFIVLEW